MKFVAFGVTGDLMRAKVIPALEKLQLDVIGVSRKPRNEVNIPSQFDFVQGDTSELQTFLDIKEKLAGEEALFYFCIAPALYKEALLNMKAAGFSRDVKIMLEKPFGRSGEEAEELYALLKDITDEQNIFINDHYAAKDWVRELGELHTEREAIAEIHIRLLETAGVEKRGSTYDKLGTLRDVGQNHMLQILKQLVPLPTPDAPTTIERTQYDGYKDTKGVAADSETETYFKIETRAGDIKIILEAGKRMPENKKEVELIFKDGSIKIFSEHSNKIPEYELLLRAAMAGDHTLFPSIEYIRAQWKFIDPLLEV